MVVLQWWGCRSIGVCGCVLVAQNKGEAVPENGHGLMTLLFFLSTMEGQKSLICFCRFRSDDLKVMSLTRYLCAKKHSPLSLGIDEERRSLYLYVHSYHST